MSDSILIIGAGIAGLSAGCYGQMNGYRSRIFEMGDKPGGLCTAWKRKGYTIDGCIHWLVGSSPESSFYRIWEQLGAVQGRKFYNHDIFTQVEGSDGRKLTVYTDIDRLEEHLEEIAPEDREATEELTSAIRTCTRHEPPIDKAPELYSFADGIRLSGKLPLLRVMKKWGKIPVKDFASRFHSPFLRETFPLIFGISDFPMASMIITLAWLNNRWAGYPIGGSLEFARAIEHRYTGLGGEIHYGSRVEKILVQDDSAVGIRLDNGEEYSADIVISAADGHSTIFEMLEGNYADDTIRGYYKGLRLFPPLIYISLGLKGTFDDIPPSVSGISFPACKPLWIDGHQVERISAQVYNFDRTIAPEGSTVMRVMLMADYDYWKQLEQKPEEYRAEKERVANQVIAALERRFPAVSGNVDMLDIATPLTFEHYTNNWRGSFEGWLPTVETFGQRMSKTLPGLNNFYMAGQWVEPGGGLPPSALSGRNVIQVLCHRDRKRFLAPTP